MNHESNIKVELFCDFDNDAFRNPMPRRIFRCRVPNLYLKSEEKETGTCTDCLTALFISGENIILLDLEILWMGSASAGKG